MYRYQAWGIAALAMAVIPGFVAAAELDPGRSAFQRFSSGPYTSPLPPAAEKPKPKPIQEAPKPSDVAAALRAQEEATLLRRIQTCDRFKSIALETGDSQLEAQAIRLEERALEVYKMRTANLPTGKTAKSAPGGDKP